MVEPTQIRESLPGDLPAIEELYPAAFPDEDLLPLVRELLQETVPTLSLIATSDADLVGHVVFTTCSVNASTDQVGLLGPLAVAQARQRQGTGSALVRAGLKHLERAGVGQVCVLGDPAYYGRFGFAPEAAVMPPYPLPEEWHGAWQVMRLRKIEPPLHGKLSVPAPWRQPRLWGP